MTSFQKVTKQTKLVNRTIRKIPRNQLSGKDVFNPLNFYSKDKIPSLNRALKIALTIPHVMEFTVIRVVEAMMALIRKGISNVLEYNDSHP
jgi:hypothetical protein